MAEIVCAECNATVPDTSEYCPECGYPFDIQAPGQSPPATVDADNLHHQVSVTPPSDIILQSLGSVKLEINDLQKSVNAVRQDYESLSKITTDTIQKSLAEITVKLGSLEAVVHAKTAEAQTAPPKKTKKELLAAFYKTLNSPNSMFEYMFYICIAQTIFIVVNLFLIAYVVTLVR